MKNVNNSQKIKHTKLNIIMSELLHDTHDFLTFSRLPVPLIRDFKKPSAGLYTHLTSIIEEDIQSSIAQAAALQ